MNPDHDVLAVARRLRDSDRPCALVSVVRALAPTSARPGDKAVVDADGVFHGWIGGGCAQPAVLRAVRQALADGRPRLIRITPAVEGHERELDDVLEFGMTCHSGGTLELFIDPMTPRPQLVVIGDTPVAVALAALAPQVGLAVTVVAHGGHPERFPDAQRVLISDDPAACAGEVNAGAIVVVATQGRRDVPGLRLALSLRAREVSLVASARKAQVLKESLLASGYAAPDVAAIVAPAGLPISAETPEEIALSVLAQVVAAHRRRSAAQVDRTTTAAVAAPVTGEALVARSLVRPGATAVLPATASASARANANPSSSCCGGGPDVVIATPSLSASLASTLEATADAAPGACVPAPAEAELAHVHASCCAS